MLSLFLSGPLSKGAWRSRKIWIDRAFRSSPSIHFIGRQQPSSLVRPQRRYRDGVVARHSAVRELPRIPKEYGMSVDTGRRNALLGFSSVALGVAALAAGPAHAEAGRSVVPQGAPALPELMARLRKAPRRRDFKTVPMILDHPDLWDDTALKEVIAYHDTRKQVWDNTDIGSPWMNLMRNSLNAQVFSFGHRDFLTVSATHGSAHLALFDQDMWDKYRLAEMAGGDFKTNTLIVGKAAPSELSDFENPQNAFGPAAHTVPPPP